MTKHKQITSVSIDDGISGNAYWLINDIAIPQYTEIKHITNQKVNKMAKTKKVVKKVVNTMIKKPAKKVIVKKAKGK